jgi:hypothetical protein
MTEHIAPVPADCDLRGLPWMPIDTVRLLDSDLFALASGDEFKAAVALWCKAWQQVPASSLPDNELILAKLSGAGARWRKVREQALRGFVRCTDGRLYHPVIAEKALEAWAHRLKQRDRAAKRWHPSGSTAANATASPAAMLGTGTGTGTGTGKGQDKTKDGKALAPSAALSAPPGTVEDPIVISIPLIGLQEFQVPKSMRDELDTLYPAVDPDQTLREIRGWNLANAKRRKTPAGIRKHIFDWFAREQDKQSRRPG